jgi:RimJ/RimL family protein N-acetyltransferase
MRFEKFDTIAKHHAERLGCSSAVFSRIGTTIVADAKMTERKRVIVNESSRHTVIQAPPAMVSQLKASLDLPRASRAKMVVEALSEVNAKVLWTDFIFHITEGWMPPIADPQVRVLESSDANALETLKARLSEPDLALGEVTLDHPIAVGVFDGARCVAAASFIYYGDDIADVGVITDPDYRGRGSGTMAVTGLLRKRGNRVVQYSAQEKNIASHKLARNLGLELFITETGLAIEQ